MLELLKKKLGEKSTWIGLVTLLGAVGVAITPELSEAIVAAGLAIVGLIAVVIKERAGE